MRLLLLAPLAILFCARPVSADYKTWKPNNTHQPGQLPPPLKIDASAPNLSIEFFTIAAPGYLVDGSTLSARLRNWSTGTVRRIPWEIRDGRRAIARGIVDYLNPTWIWVLQAKWKPQPGTHQLTVVIDPGNKLRNTAPAASRSRSMTILVKAKPSQPPPPATATASPSSRTGSGCFGAAGGECQGPPVGTCDPPRREGNGAHYGNCQINGGSWQHDTCCWEHPEGWFCSKQGFGGAICKDLFDTAVYRTGSGLNWSRKVNQDTLNASGTVVRSQYCALKGSYVHADDAKFCCSNSSRDLRPGEFHTAVAIGQHVKICDGSDPQVGPDTP